MKGLVEFNGALGHEYGHERSESKEGNHVVVFREFRKILSEIVGKEAQDQAGKTSFRQDEAGVDGFSDHEDHNQHTQGNQSDCQGGKMDFPVMPSLWGRADGKGGLAFQVF